EREGRLPEAVSLVGACPRGEHREHRRPLLEEAAGERNEVLVRVTVIFEPGELLRHRRYGALECRIGRQLPRLGSDPVPPCFYLLAGENPTRAHEVTDETARRRLCRVEVDGNRTRRRLHVSVELVVEVALLDRVKAVDVA